MIALAAVIISLAAIIFIGIGLIDYAHERKKESIRYQMTLLSKELAKSDRRRNASEMATVIKLVERECRRTRH